MASAPWRGTVTGTGVSGMGAVVHTINPRLSAEQIEFIANHAEDQYLFFDLSFVSLVEQLAPCLKTVKTFIALCDRDQMPKIGVPVLICYEDFIAEQSRAVQCSAVQCSAVQCSAVNYLPG